MLPTRWWISGVVGAVLTLSCQVEAQSAVVAADSQARVLQVFLDCQRSFCDDDFVRAEIAFVNFVRDRQLADVHIAVTQQGTGGAGSEFTLEFIGLQRRAAMRDTVVFNTNLGDSEDDVRKSLTRQLSQGLVRYVRGTRVVNQLQVVFRPVTTPSSGASRGVKDRWNYWVYRVSANANLDANANFSSQNYGGRLSANRVTDTWKLQFSTRGNYSKRTFVLSDGEISSLQRAFGGSADIIRSINAHWSTGVQLSVQKDLFRNYDMELGVRPGIEYNVFPYSQSTKRQLLVRYSAGVRSFNYADTTIFGLLQETRPTHSLVVSADAVQPWGSVGVSLNASQYLNDLSKRQFGVFGNARWRIVRGLDFNIAMPSDHA